MLFALPAAIALPIVAGILLAGPGLGFLVAVVAAAIVVGVAIRMEPREWRRRAARAERGRAPAESHEPGDRGWRRAAARRMVVPLVVATAGIVLIAAAGGTARIIGWGVLALAATMAVSLVFLEVGYSEDRARAREERARRPARFRRPPAFRRGSRDTEHGIRR